MDWEFDILYAIQSIRTPFLDKVMAFYPPSEMQAYCGL